MSSMEHVFFGLHTRFVNTITSFFTPKLRLVGEYLLFLTAFVLLICLIWLHVCFVYPSAYRGGLNDIVEMNDENMEWNGGCLSQKLNEMNLLHRNDLDNIDLIYLRISTYPENNEDCQEEICDIKEYSFSNMFYDHFLSYLDLHYEDTRVNKHDILIKDPNNVETMLTDISKKTGMKRNEMNEYLDNRPEIIKSIFEDRVYIFSLQKGILMLPPYKRIEHNIKALNITIYKSDSCFNMLPSSQIHLNSENNNNNYYYYTEKINNFLLKHIVGYDTVVLNWFLELYGHRGFVFSIYSHDLYSLSQASTSSEANELDNFITFKIGVSLTTLFLFFTTTTLVSFTLKETQERMLKFTYLLQHNIRNRLPYGPLVLTHVIESLVFVPIMVGILFFLFEFFSDQFLAFMVFSGVWICEVFSVISVRTPESIRYFPRIFFMFFTIYHLYIFSYPFGYSYLSLVISVTFLGYSMLFFWNRFEIPALEEGLVTIERPRILPYGFRNGSYDHNILSFVSQSNLNGRIVGIGPNQGINSSLDSPSISNQSSPIGLPLNSNTGSATVSTSSSGTSSSSTSPNITPGSIDLSSLNIDFDWSTQRELQQSPGFDPASFPRSL